MIKCDKPLRVNAVEFSVEHSGCDFISKVVDAVNYIDDIYYYAESYLENNDLRKFYKAHELSKQGLIYSSNIGSDDISSVN